MPNFWLTPFANQSSNLLRTNQILPIWIYRQIFPLHASICPLVLALHICYKCLCRRNTKCFPWSLNTIIIQIINSVVPLPVWTQCETLLSYLDRQDWGHLSFWDKVRDLLVCHPHPLTTSGKKASWKQCFWWSLIYGDDGHNIFSLDITLQKGPYVKFPPNTLPPTTMYVLFICF